MEEKKKKRKVTKMLNKVKRIESNKKEIEDYIEILNDKMKLVVSFPKVEDDLSLFRQSWEKIWIRSGEDIGYFLRHILFTIQMETDKNEIDNYKNITKDDKESKQIFFESIFNVSNPLDIPFNMTDNDFEKFNHFFNRKK